MLDSFGNTIEKGMVVEIAGSCSKKNNGLWVVDDVFVHPNDEIWLNRLNKDMRKAKSSATSSMFWPLRSWASNYRKRCETNAYNK